VYQLPEVMEGKVDEILAALQAHDQMEKLKAQGLGG
jgi:protein subunit release factor A